MIKLAIIGASYLQLPLALKAKEMGLYTLCFAWAEGAVCKNVVNEFYPISIVEKDEILAICREKQINGICTIASDVAAPTVAYVAEKMGLRGNTYKAAITANNKYLMRNALQNAGLLCPLYKRMKSVDECLLFTVEVCEKGLIVKPTDRSGSLGVTKVETVDELPGALENALNSSFNHEAIVEEYVEGREISVEFISYQGKHYPLQITDKVTTGAPHFVELEHHQPAKLSNEQFVEIYDMTAKALTALGITNGASHSEYKITADGLIYVIEIGARMGGDFIGSHLVQLSTEYDFLKGVIDVALGQFTIPVMPEHNCSGVYFLSAETQRVKHYIDHAAEYREIVSAQQTDDELHALKCSADRSGYFIYKSNKKFCI